MLEFLEFLVSFGVVPFSDCHFGGIIQLLSVIGIRHIGIDQKFLRVVENFRSGIGDCAAAHRRQSLTSHGILQQVHFPVLLQGDKVASLRHDP